MYEITCTAKDGKLQERLIEGNFRLYIFRSGITARFRRLYDVYVTRNRNLYTRKTILRKTMEFDQQKLQESKKSDELEEIEESHTERFDKKYINEKKLITDKRGDKEK